MNRPYRSIVQAFAWALLTGICSLAYGEESSEVSYGKEPGGRTYFQTTRKTVSSEEGTKYFIEGSTSDKAPYTASITESSPGIASVSGSYKNSEGETVPYKFHVEMEEGSSLQGVAKGFSPSQIKGFHPEKATERTGEKTPPSHFRY